MEQIKGEELEKINAFVESCNDMINGKFILADIKIMRILNMIESSEPLSTYIKECMINFDFAKEFHHSEVKNRFNNGQFAIPADHKSMVAMVFSLLLAFNTKKLDFYEFINTNFSTLTKGGEYASFAQNLLVPFKDIIAQHFGLYGENPAKTLISEPNDVEVNNIQEENNQDNNNEQDEDVEKIWKDLPILVDSMMNTILLERKLKADQKEQINYILKTIKYASKYKDIRLVSALLTCVDCLTIKAHATRFILNDLKQEIKDYFDKYKNN